MAWALERDGSGEPVLHLEVGQPDFETPSECVEAARVALEEPSMQKYIPNAGIPELRAGIARYYMEQRLRPGSRATVTEDRVLVSHGGVCAMAAAFMATLDPGDEVLLPDPAWPNYEMATRLFGPGQPVPYRLDADRGWMPDLDDVRRRITARTKVLVICSPANPTGAVLDEVTMQQLLNIAMENGLYVVSDEIYSALNFAEGYPQSLSALDCEHDPRATMVVSGVSKAWAMTGFRVGWLIADPEIVTLGAKLQEAFISCGVPAAQRAALAALRDPATPGQVRTMVSRYHRRRDVALAALRRHGLESYSPGGAMYLLVPCGTADADSPAFCRRLLQERRVAVTPGTTFGANSRHHVRISFGAADDVVEEGMDRLCRALLHKP